MNEISRLRIAPILYRLSAIARRFNPSRTARRYRQQVQTIRESPLFEERWYLETYPDVAAAGVDPAAHFFEIGWREGRDPGPHFATSAYLKSNDDVSKSGINPLLHYIEFGHSECRELQSSRVSPAVAMFGTDSFDEAAPVLAGPLPLEAATRWRRWYHLDADDPRLLSADEWRAGYVSSAKQRSILDSAFRQLRRLSGYGPPAVASDEDDQELGLSIMLTDAWFTNPIQLRTRWSLSSVPFVVRAFQHDQPGGGAVSLVADGLVTSPLDFVEASLNNPYFPVLFVFTEPDGTIRGARSLAFPSMCRGGIHYSELLALTDQDSRPDPIGTGLAQAARLASATAGSGRLIRSIGVDLEGSDGRSPLFQNDFRTWLKQVAKLSVEPLEPSSGASDVPEAGTSEEKGTRLVLASDMIPTINALTALADGGECEDIFLPFLVAGPDPSQPAMLVDIPAVANKALGATAAGYPPPMPRLSNASGSNGPPKSLGAAAIRLAPGRQPSDSELLIPAMGSALPTAQAEKATVTWLIVASEWDCVELLECVRALSTHSVADGHYISFIGEPDEIARSVTAIFFPGRSKTHESFDDAIGQVETDFIGYLGPGVILHDPRSSELLQGILDDPEIVSASCPIVTTEKRGKSWHVSVVDTGGIPGPEPQRTLATQCLHAQLLWRASYPASQPPRDLWLAHTSSIRRLFGAEPVTQLDTGMHICTTLVTAAYCGQRRHRSAALALPRAPDDRTIRTRTLYG